MQESDLFQSLAHLEKSLADVNSAAEMVKTTTAACDALQDRLQAYADALAHISALIADVIRDVTTGQQTSTRLVEQRVTTTLRQVDSAIEELAGTNAAIREATQTLGNKLEEGIDGITQDLKTARNELTSTKDTAFSALQATTNLAKDLDKTLDAKVEAVLQEGRSLLHASTDGLMAANAGLKQDIAARFDDLRESLAADHRSTGRRLAALLTLQLLSMALTGLVCFWLLHS
ncbi:MAG: hypothetical protein IJU37_13080 [Desulfovibrio sp.]|nr:hypothetical protein [Desulfovibrio sp.]